MTETVITSVIESHGKKNMPSCPRCKSELTRISRSSVDHILDKATLGIFKMRRFYCGNCNWQGVITRFGSRR